MTSHSDSPLSKIVQSLTAEMPEHLDTDELSVITMAAHLHAVYIDALPKLTQRRAEVHALSPGIAEMVKSELMQMHDLRKPTNGT